jgi:uncharacterized membrane protein YkoI
MRMKLATVTILLGVAVLAGAFPLLADEDGGEHSRAKKVGAILAQVKVKMADAVKKAEEKAGGTAIRAELEAEDDEIVYDILVIVVKGETVSAREIEIDAKTGEILDDEPYADDDEGEDDDHDDGEDDDEDEDDDEHEHDD